MSFTQVRYLNGGGGGGSLTAAPGVVGGTGLSDPARYVLRGPWHWLAWPQFENQQNIVTDLDILAMDPADAVPLYYDLNQYRKASTGGLTYEWDAAPLAGISDGLSPSEAESYERGLRERIYLLRGDLHTITLPDGRKVQGLVDLSKIRTIPETGLTVGGQVFKWAIIVASGILTAGAGLAIELGLLVESLTFSAIEVTAELRRGKEQLALVDRAIGGAYAIVGKNFRDQLLRFGVNLRPYEEATGIETSTLAWQLALAIGLPHPAMVCASQAESIGCGPGVQPYAFCGRTWAPTEVCSPAAQEYFLTGVLNWIKERFLFENRRLVEDAVRFNGKWQLKNQLEPFTRAGVPRIMAIVPSVFVVNGRVMLQDGATGRYVDPAAEPDLAAVMTWLQLRNYPDITKPVGAAVGMSRAVRGPVPPSDVLADMARALPLAPPLLFTGGASSLPAPVAAALPPVEALPLSPPPQSATPATLPAAFPAASPRTASPGAIVGPGDGRRLAGIDNSWLLIGAAVAGILFAGGKRKK